MNFLVIGHSVADKIIVSGKVSVKPGGIFYTVVSFLSQMQPGEKLYLCSAVDEGNKKLFKDAYDRVETDFLVSVDSIPLVELVVDDAGERKEKYSLIADNLSIPTGDLNRFDGILINMISGFDISLQQLKNIRKNYDGLIYFDVHTLSRGVDRNMNRIFRPVPAFNQWAECIDILQANEPELQTLSDKINEMDIVEELLSYRIGQIVITRAERGATVYLKQNDSFKKFYKDAVSVKVKNKIGCGDVFGAVYFYNYLKNKNVLLALKQANLFAGTASTYSDSKNYFNLKKDAAGWFGKK
jgi:sugar/nucleoside kinase (ribokinase family)